MGSKQGSFETCWGLLSHPEHWVLGWDRKERGAEVSWGRWGVRWHAEALEPYDSIASQEPLDAFKQGWQSDLCFRTVFLWQVYWQKENSIRETSFKAAAFT